MAISKSGSLLRMSRAVTREDDRPNAVDYAGLGLRDPHEAVNPIVWVNVEPHDDPSRRNA